MGLFDTRPRQLTEIHDNIPDTYERQPDKCKRFGKLTAVECVEGGKEDEEYFVMLCPVNLPQALAHIVQNSHSIFAAVDKMRKDVLRVAVSSDALKGAPYPRQCREEPHEP